jgi:serine/threonine-protein kinase
MNQGILKLEHALPSPKPRSSDPGLELGPSGRTLLQERLFLYGLVVMSFNLAFSIWFCLTWSHEPGSKLEISSAIVGLQAVATAMPLVAWLRGLGLRALRTLDLFSHAAIGLSLMSITGSMKVQAFGLYEDLLGITGLLATRALLVPSSACFTLLVGVATFLPTGLRVLAGSADFALPLLTPETVRMTFVGRSLLSIAFSTLGSAVLYRLRREVREARRLGQHTLEERLGEGGMGVVYRARHAMLRRPTAIKLLRGDSGSSPARFEREAQLTATLTHPNSVVVHDYGRTADGVLYYAMEYLDGIDLEQLVTIDGAQPPGRVIHLLRQACGALAEAHSLGLIHRDVKPANLFLCRRPNDPDFLKVLDFGMVRHLAGSSRVATSTNALVGTPDYMAPELFSNPAEVFGSADLYGLGAVGYRLLTAKTVFEGHTLVQICAQHLHAAPVPPSVRVGAKFPPDLEALVLRCLSKDPAARFASAEALASELERCAKGCPWTHADARAWWSARGEQLGKAVPGAPPAPHTQLVIAAENR